MSLYRGFLAVIVTSDHKHREVCRDASYETQTEQSTNDASRLEAILVLELHWMPEDVQVANPRAQCVEEALVPFLSLQNPLSKGKSQNVKLILSKS